MMLRQAVVAFVLIAPCTVSAWDKKPVIAIQGVPEELGENIRNHLSLATEDCKAPLWRLEAMLQKADMEIHEAGQALGYYHLQAEKKFIPGPKCWRLELQIDPGPTIAVEEINIDISGAGRDDMVFNTLPAQIVIRPGDQLDHGKYEAIKKHLATLATTRGYFDAKFIDSVIMVDTVSNSARIKIRYDTGARYRFGPVTIDQSVLSPRLINRYITFTPGEAYNSDKLIELQQALGSNYFSQVNVRPLVEQADNGSVPIKIDMVPLKQHSFSLGVGAATDTGPRVKFDYENRYLNPAGHRFNSGISLAPRHSEILAGYTIPLHSPRHENLQFFTGFEDEETDTSRSETSSLGGNYSFLNRGEWLQTWSLNFERETFTVSDTRDRSNLLIPGLSFAKTRSTDSVYPMYGWMLNASMQGASAGVFSDISFAQLQANAKYIHALGHGRVLLRAGAGTTDVSDFDALPASLRFFAGGDISVRGYEYRSLGPADAEGNVTGGRHLLLAGIEYDRRILSQWAIAAFYDAGNAFNSSEGFELKSGTGLGLRWLSPIGPIRLDVAKALDDTKAWRVHIRMGPDL